MKDENLNKNYDVVLPPNIHMGFTKDELMLKTFLLMSIIAFASVIIMGINALIHIITAIGTVLITHNLIFAYQKMKGKDPTYESPSSPLVAGLIVGLSMPIASTFEITAGVAFLTILVFKYGQGKVFKRKFLNPAAASKVLLLLVLSIIILFEEPLSTGMIFHPHHLELNLFTDEGFRSSMWIFQRVELPLIGKLTATQSLFFWQTHGWIGGTCGILVMIVGTIGAYWLRFKWRIIASTITTMTVLAVGIALLTGGDMLMRIAFHVFTGSVIFMVFFMATEPQSTPIPEKSQILFGICLAVLTFILQLYNVLGGSIIALIVLNSTTPFLDRIGIKKPYGIIELTGDA